MEFKKKSQDGGGRRKKNKTNNQKTQQGKTQNYYFEWNHVLQSGMCLVG